MSQSSPRRLRTTARCPHCGAFPRLRTVPWIRAILRHADRDTVIVTYQCHVRKCGTIYEITVGDFMDAA